jgi:hypothetical protein
MMPHRTLLANRLPHPALAGRSRHAPRTRLSYRTIQQWDPDDPILGWVLPRNRQLPMRGRAGVWRRCAAIARGLGYGGIDVTFLPVDGDAGDEAAAVGSPVDQYLAEIAHDRDLVVLASGPAVADRRTHTAAVVLWRELGSHGGSLAVLGWTAQGQPASVDDAPKHLVLNCVSCAPTLAGDPLCEHDRRFDRLLRVAA